MKTIYSDKELIKVVERYVDSVSLNLRELAFQRSELVRPNLKKILKVFAVEKIGSQHFTSLTGYGHNDINRDVIDKVFAKVLGAEKAAVRMQFVSGTHAISTAFFGVLRPKDNLLSVIGRPYETLEEVIGLRGKGNGSLIEFGINYDEINILKNELLDLNLLKNALKKPRKIIFIQRSCGYSWRKSLSINDINKICNVVHSIQPNCICFVDNCYGEFVEDREPCDVGADLVAGSLIKNPGGTIVPTGGYIAGNASLVEQACCRLTSPGIGSGGGISFDLNRIILQGLFLSPQFVSESLIGADLIAATFSDLGFKVLPEIGQKRSDLIQAIELGSPDLIKCICKAFQESSPVGSYLNPVASDTIGYESSLIMSGGTFIDGSTSEFSADAPLKPPYVLFVQGGTHRSHIKIALINSIIELYKAGFIKLPQNRNSSGPDFDGL